MMAARIWLIANLAVMAVAALCWWFDVEYSRPIGFAIITLSGWSGAYVLWRLK